MDNCDCLCCQLKQAVKKIGAVAGSALMVGMTMGGTGNSSQKGGGDG